MKITCSTQGEITICGIEGEVNLGTSPELRKTFEQFIRANIKKVLIDFSAVSYIDSSGLATLIELFQRLKKTGGNLRLYGMSARIKGVFEVTKLHKLFEIFENREAALENF